MTEQTTAIVTGAGGDIGRAIAASLSRTHRVIVADILLAAAEKTAASLDATALQYDITDPASVADFAKAVRAIGAVSVLVNNAGASHDVSLHARTEAGLSADLNLNLAGAIRMFKAFGADLIDTNGCLINIASANGIGTFGHPVDCGLLAGQSVLAATFTQSADFTR